MSVLVLVGECVGGWCLVADSRGSEARPGGLGLRGAHLDLAPFRLRGYRGASLVRNSPPHIWFLISNHILDVVSYERGVRGAS